MAAPTVESSGSTGVIIGVIVCVIIALLLVLVFFMRRALKLNDFMRRRCCCYIRKVKQPKPPTSLEASRFMKIYNQPESRPNQLYALMTTDDH